MLHDTRYYFFQAYISLSIHRRATSTSTALAAVPDVRPTRTDRATFVTGETTQDWQQRIHTYRGRGSIIVHLTSYFTGLDSTKQTNLLLI